MLNIKKYGAIDVGSNAIRLLIVTVIEQEGKEAKFKKTSLIRVPIRLGTDVFVEGKVSEASYLRMLDSFKAFQLLMKIHNVFKYRACATSAMREAKNGKTVVKRLLNATGIEINIINGNEEAKIIASTDLKTYLVHDKVFLYVDVGGGSTELTIYSEGKTVASKSFKMGTVRLINNLVDDKMWDQMKDWIKNNTQKYSHITLLGTGGNINSTYKYSGKKIGTPFDQDHYVRRLLENWDLDNLAGLLEIPVTRLRKIALESFGRDIERIQHAFISMEILIRLFVHGESYEEITEQFKAICR